MTRILTACHSLLAHAAAESAAPLVLLLEDDLAFAPGFVERLARWFALQAFLATGEPRRRGRMVHPWTASKASASPPSPRALATPSSTTSPRSCSTPARSPRGAGSFTGPAISRATANA